ncbi:MULTISPECIES: excinuclease ABC subunit UvrC [unclassified Spirosoma]|uniref:excinuclease ABC subunit UvrC n=1 Tax=unclassified Spirosoma TaxID=2621999 RepID=UPI00095E401E|nr:MULTISPECIES: excinuclease ABC subunit UvrC [unclassified Spirosoma]MBN8822006.1 excinuclease ABC subunit C [Spirosoma sp.]OJW80875.1 MAG: excinuclease ABC subunit C [Spirosoma sp. 48-14]
MPEFDYKQELTKVPHEPGVYRYFDATGEVIYVGKAKDLKNRVSSYFTNSKGHDRKTLRLVSQIRKIEFTIVHTEFDALLLENQLIKRYQPKYNILLRDDKTYPFVCVTNEHFPRVLTTRQIDRKLGTYYGPFANLKPMYTVLDMFSQLFTIRTCNYNLAPENIAAGKYKVCLEYHIGNCKGPCEGRQNEADYEKDIEQIHHILKGNLKPAQEYFKGRMLESASELAFEQAQKYKEKIDVLQRFQSKSTVVNPKIADADVFSIASDELSAYINFMKVVNGTIVQTHTVEVKKKLDEADPDLLAMMIVEFREQYGSQAKEIITNIPLDVDLKAEITVPQIGDKKKLLDMSLKNVLYFRRERQERVAAEATANASKKDRVLIRLKQDLQLKTIPNRIECFDNSNIQGTNPVSAMVCFIGGKPANREYRHFSIKTVVGPNDFASMYEVVTRRYSRVLTEGTDMPDLIVIDGGKGQLSAACDALKAMDLYGKVPIIGIAKRLEEIYFPEDNLPLYIDKKSESLKLIQRIRDEAHRFAITYHRDKRSRNSLISELENVEGIGKKTAAKLLKHFKGVKKIREANFDEVAEIVGKDRAQKLKEYFETIEQ